MKNQRITDSDLIHQYKAGNPEAFGILIDRYKDKLYSYLVIQTKDQHLAEDIFQDTFIKVMKSLKRDKYVDEGRFLSWMIRIAHNLVIDHYRKQSQMRCVVNEDVEYDVFNAARFSEGTIEDELIQHHINKTVVQLIHLLPDDQRQVVMLRHFVGLSFKEIAEQTGVSINTALGRMRYALINLRRIIEEKKISLTV